MAKIVTCAICGVKFKTNRPNKKYCSYSCKEASAKVKRVIWEERNPEYNKNYMKKYRESQKDNDKDKKG